MLRIGFGIDFHQLKEGNDLWLGGIKIDAPKGTVGHSDADVLLHAICDALLGAVNLGDIGVHFPDTDFMYKNIDSKILLKKCHELVKEKKYGIINIDSTVTLEIPKLRPHISSMQKTIAQVLEMDENDVSIKATTTEKLGFVGREEGIAAYAIILLNKIGTNE